MIGGDGSRSVPDPPLVNISTLPDGSRLVHPSFLFFSFLQEARHRLLYGNRGNVFFVFSKWRRHFRISREAIAFVGDPNNSSNSSSRSLFLSLSIRVLKLLVAGQWYARSSTQFQKLRKITVNRLVCPSLHWAIR